jgi:hypothetical protein
MVGLKPVSAHVAQWAGLIAGQVKKAQKVSPFLSPFMPGLGVAGG